MLSIAGAIIGAVGGALIAFYHGRQLFMTTGAKFGIDWNSAIIVGLVTICICTLAAAIPAIWSSGRNPADIVGADQ